MYILKTNTATRIAVGPLVDPTDGKTAETGLTVTDLSVQLYQLKNDGGAVTRSQFAPTASGGNNDMVLVASSTDGMYDLELTAAQLNFLGNARISFYDIDGFWFHYIDVQVVSAAYFNWVYGSTSPSVLLADGAHGGSSASLNLGAGATISSANGSALALTSSGGNGHGLIVQGNGTGSGLTAVGGGTSGNGIYAAGDADGHGIYATGGDAALGLTAGMYLKSNSSGTQVGLYVEDGAIITDDAGTALTISSFGGNGDGVTIVGNGSGGDLVADITGNLSGSIGSVGTNGINAASLDADASSELNTAVLAAISGIGTAGGAAINVDAATSNVTGGITGVTSSTTFLGTQSVGTFANTSNVNAVYHTITGTAAGNTAMDVVYQFLTGSGTNPVQATWVGYVTGTNDTITVSAWRHDTGAWESMTTIVGTSGTTIQTKNITLFTRHRGTSAAELGKVYLRLHCAGMSTPVVATDQIVVSYAVTSRGTYSDGAVWLNTAASNTNTQSYVDGLPENPVSTIAAAITIADALNLKRIRVANGSTVTFAASMASRSLIGRNWTCALGGQAIDGAYIEGASVSGTGTCTTAVEFVDCHIGAGTTTGPAQFFRCGFAGTSGSKVTAGSAGEFLLIDCFSEVAGSGTPHFSFPGACGINIRRWSGGSNITLNNTSATLTMEVVTGGGQTIELGGADAEIRGICRSVTLTGITTDSTAQINCVTGPISLAGADGTVNIYGVCGAITDSRTGTPLGTNSAISLVNVNAQADTAIADGLDDIADTILGRNVSGGSSTGRLVKEALHVLRNKVAVADGTMTVYDTDDASTSWTATVIGTEGADPITTINPA